MTEFAGKIKSSARSMLCTPYHRLLNVIDPPVIVLLYHRVTTLASDPERLAVTPDNFRAHLRYLKEYHQVVRFEEDWSAKQKPAIVLTFDDGYADNALEALPIIEEVGAPATFFVSTGPIGAGLEFWWHELESLVQTKNLPHSFTLNDGSFSKTWPTGTDAERQILYRDLVRFMTDADSERRNDWLSQLRSLVGGGNAPGTEAHRAMSITELRLIAASPWATIGAHTVTHTSLSSLPLEAQREEMTASRRQLEEWLGKEVDTFAYPYGRRCHYTKESVALCRQIGFSKAAANFPGQAHRWTDPYQIPRHLVRNWPIDIFVEKLRGFWTR